MHPLTCDRREIIPSRVVRKRSDPRSVFEDLRTPLSEQHQPAALIHRHPERHEVASDQSSTIREDVACRDVGRLGWERGRSQELERVGGEEGREGCSGR